MDTDYSQFLTWQNKLFHIRNMQPASDNVYNFIFVVKVKN